MLQPTCLRNNFSAPKKVCEGGLESVTLLFLFVAQQLLWKPSPSACVQAGRQHSGRIMDAQAATHTL